MCDSVFLQCKKRFYCTSHLEASKLLHLNNASNFVRAGQFLMTSLENCVKAYPMLD